MAQVKLENVWKRYGEHEVVKEFTLDITDREFVVFVGPSGCGKSTTLRMIAGLEEISEGELIIGDRIVNDVHPKDRDIAMVFQNYALYPHMTVFQNMAFALKLRNMPKKEIQERVEEAARVLDISHLLDRKPKALSGGQRQRVALGRAIVRQPQVFLMDEPLSNLDAKLRVQMRIEISKLHQRLSATTIYVTHDQTEAMTMGDRIVVMKDGVIQQVDTPYGIFNNPANIFVASFIGSPSMNLLDGELYEENGQIHFRAEGIDVIIPEHREEQLRKGNYVGKEVVFGIRPEDVHSETVFLEANPFESAIVAEVDIVENMGSELYLYFNNVANKQMIARVNAREGFRQGMKVNLALDLNKCHIFDKETEQTIF